MLIVACLPSCNATQIVILRNGRYSRFIGGIRWKVSRTHGSLLRQCAPCEAIHDEYSLSTVNR